MAPSPLRKRLTNEDKMKIIEESKQPGFQTLHHMFSNYMDSFFLNTYVFWWKTGITDNIWMSFPSNEGESTLHPTK